ncbi:hypothetical protein LY76DRAFT_319397 [Colletotrichum caudatum]|nr:hypothetical protein LY76DRAFT_319397 [Colletotrichum caudatum]
MKRQCRVHLAGHSSSAPRNRSPGGDDLYGLEPSSPQPAGVPTVRGFRTRTSQRRPRDGHSKPLVRACMTINAVSQSTFSIYPIRPHRIGSLPTLSPSTIRREKKISSPATCPPTPPRTQGLRANSARPVHKQRDPPSHRFNELNRNGRLAQWQGV